VWQEYLADFWDGQCNYEVAAGSQIDAAGVAAGWLAGLMMWFLHQPLHSDQPKQVAVRVLSK